MHFLGPRGRRVSLGPAYRITFAMPGIEELTTFKDEAVVGQKLWVFGFAVDAFGGRFLDDCDLELFALSDAGSRASPRCAEGYCLCEH